MVLPGSALVCLMCLLGSVALGYRRFYGDVQSFRYGHCLHKGLQCVNLSQCPPIGRQVHPSSDYFLAMARLKAYMCGENRGTVQVCCPKDSVIHPTPKPRVTGTRPDTSLVRHRNFNLINRNCGVGLTDRIVGGLNASPGEFPWLAVLQYNVSGELQYMCGGSLITDMYVLTAAHCIASTFSNSSVKLVSLKLGEYDLESEEDCSLNNRTVRCPDTPRDYAPSDFVLHSGFNHRDKTLFKNDIALIRLRTRVDFSEYVHPVCLPVPGRLTTNNGVLSSLSLTVAGWGMTDKSMGNSVLMKVEVPYLDPEMCSYSLRGRRVLPGQLCAGGLPAMNACNGDSGGPLTASIFSSGGTRICYQVGIVSIGFGSCLSSNPSIYTSVEHFIPWILDNIRD